MVVIDGASTIPVLLRPLLHLGYELTVPLSFPKIPWQLVLPAAVEITEGLISGSIPQKLFSGGTEWYAELC